MALTCGNHCALKVGKGLCCSVHAMMPIRANAFVYFEFSVTVTGQQTPSLALGLAPPDCPLNVMVGSWPRSVGLYSDGQMLVGSRWFPDMSSRPSKIAAGATVGILVYLRDPSQAISEADAIDLEILGALAAQVRGGSVGPHGHAAYAHIQAHTPPPPHMHTRTHIHKRTQTGRRGKTGPVVA